MAKYACKHCGQILERDSKKQWIKSYCSGSGKNVRLQRKKKFVRLAENLCTPFLTGD